MGNSYEMRLIVFHSHYRPGGVRRIIELALPALVHESRLRVDSLVLAGGEAPSTSWLASLRRQVPGVNLVTTTEAAAGYFSEIGGNPTVGQVRATLVAWVEAVLGETSGADTVVWAHNLGLGRNLAAISAWVDGCGRRGVRLVAHHHDWWFDNRWQRWPELLRMGGRSLAAVARTVFSTTDHVRHATINRADQHVLARELGGRVGWLPNLAEAGAAPSKMAVDAARVWLNRVLAERAPVWLVPCRMLRRKNFAEALLLTRWLRPEAWLVTTGGVSSAEEQPYSAALQAAATRHGWRVKFSVLAGIEKTKPTVAALMGVSEAVLLTSLQEGFGLPNLEAAAAGRPLLVRTLQNIAPDLAEFGFRFPQAYSEIWIERTLFDARAETARQEAYWQAWRAGLPRTCRAWATRPPWWDASGPVAFSRLTLTAQLEVLAHPAEESWARCAPLNFALRRWRGRVATKTLRVSNWPRDAVRRLGSKAYGRGFAQLLETMPGMVTDGASERISKEFFRAKLAGENQYPMLWSLNS